MGVAFAPPGQDWVPVSPRLASARRIVLAATLAVVALVAVPALAYWRSWRLAALVLGGVLGLGAWGWAIIGRQVRAIRYAERDDDLLVARGVLYRQLVVVPYGRMQFVDVTAGPLDRRFGLATVQLHTAAAATDATIPGLPEAGAADLRDRLAARGEARSAGL